MKNRGIVADYLTFLRRHKAWWIGPIIVLLLLLGALLIVTEGSPLAPVIYAIF